jgi:hypothetical protein
MPSYDEAIMNPVTVLLRLYLVSFSPAVWRCGVASLFLQVLYS